MNALYIFILIGPHPTNSDSLFIVKSSTPTFAEIIHLSKSSFSLEGKSILIKYVILSLYILILLFFLACFASIALNILLESIPQSSTLANVLLHSG